MADKKLSSKDLAKAKSLGISGETDADIRPEVLKRLQAEEVDGVDNDDITDLLDILLAFKESNTPVTVSEEVEGKDVFEEAEEADDEEEVIPTKKAKKEKVVETTDEDLAELAVEAEAKKVVKPKKEKVKKETNSNFEIYDGDVAKHLELMKKELAFLSKKTGYITEFKRSCIPTRIESSVSGRAIITIENIKIYKDGAIHYKVVFNGLNLFKNTEDLGETLSSFLPEEFHDRVVCTNNSYPYVKRVVNKEIEQIITNPILEKMSTKIQKLDTKLNDNRKKMEESLK